MSELKALNVLIAPVGQLQGNGQLRESFHERRDRRGSDYPMWYLNSELVSRFNISDKDGYEAVVAEDPSTIAWLKLRFGGEKLSKELNIDELWEYASLPPDPPEIKNIAIKK